MIVDVLARLAGDVQKAVEDGYYRDFADRAPPPTEPAPSLAAAVRRDAPYALLAEVKPASPSQGDLSGGAGLAHARSRLDLYRRFGVTGISVLTERETFHGSLDLLQEAASPPRATRVPVLMKDFVVHPDQLDAAKAAGASAVLLLHHLIVRGDTPWDIDGAIAAVHERGLEVLYEVDNAQALEHALTTDADIVGINNRDLRTLEMDKDRAPNLLRHRLDQLGGRPVLALSGVENRTDAEAMRQGGASGVLVGTSLMAATDPRRLLRELMDVVHVKCCGAGHPDDGDDVIEALSRADAVGCVVDAGGAKRDRTTAEAKALFDRLPDDVERIVVTTQTEPGLIASLLDDTGATGVQVHKELAPETLQAIRDHIAPRTLTALQHLDEGSDGEGLTDMLFAAEQRGRSADRLLLDARPQTGDDAGGTGRRIDIEGAARVTEGLPATRIVLAGGLDPDDVDGTIRFVRPYGVDVSSGIETAPGRKDPARIHRFITAARQVRGLHDQTTTTPTTPDAR